MRRPVKYALWALGALVAAYLLVVVVEIGMLSGRFVTIVTEDPERKFTISLTSTDMIQPLLQQIRDLAQRNGFKFYIERPYGEIVFRIELSRPDLMILADNEIRVRRFGFSFSCPEPRGVFGTQGPIAPKPELDHIEAELKDIASHIPGASFQPNTTDSDGEKPFPGCPSGPP